MALKDWTKKVYGGSNFITFTRKKNPNFDYITITKSNYPIKNLWTVEINTSKSLGIKHFYYYRQAAINHAMRYMKKYSD